MPCCEINSLDDPRLAPYRHLKRTNATRWSREFIAEGDKLVRRLLSSGHEVRSLLLGRSYVPKFEPLLERDVPIYSVPDRSIEEIIGFNFHRGVLACGRRPENPTPRELLANLGGSATIVICPDVQDPVNLGTLLRTGLAFGVDAFLVGTHSADPYSRRVLRTSMGATLRLPLARVARLASALCDLQGEFDFELVAAVTDSRAEPLNSVQPAPRTALVFGSEAHGLSEELVALCDRRVTIPMTPSADSLNVAIAAGIMLYHFARPAGRGTEATCRSEGFAASGLGTINKAARVD